MSGWNESEVHCDGDAAQGTLMASLCVGSMGDHGAAVRISWRPVSLCVQAVPVVSVHPVVIRWRSARQPSGSVVITAHHAESPESVALCYRVVGWSAAGRLRHMPFVWVVVLRSFDPMPREHAAIGAAQRGRASCVVPRLLGVTCGTARYRVAASAAMGWTNGFSARARRASGGMSEWRPSVYTRRDAAAAGGHG